MPTSHAPFDRRSLLLGLSAVAAGVACGGSSSASAKPPRERRRKTKDSSTLHETVIPPPFEVGMAPAGIDEYSIAHSIPESEVMRAIAVETRAMTKWWIMMIGPIEAALLRLLVQQMSARRVLEIGTFTGYSAIAMAEGLPADGTLITLDISEEWTEVARRHWARSPHGKKIDLRLGDANETLESLDGPFDLVFIDADKGGYVDYWEAVVPKLSPRGLVVADNVLGGGSVVSEPKRSHAAHFNQHVKQDTRMEGVLLPIRDGVSVHWRRA